MLPWIWLAGFVLILTLVAWAIVFSYFAPSPLGETIGYAAVVAGGLFGLGWSVSPHGLSKIVPYLPGFVRSWWLTDGAWLRIATCVCVCAAFSGFGVEHGLLDMITVRTGVKGSEAFKVANWRPETHGRHSRCAGFDVVGIWLLPARGFCSDYSNRLIAPPGSTVTAVGTVSPFGVDLHQVLWGHTVLFQPVTYDPSPSP
jgi:hypothetical protein